MNQRGSSQEAFRNKSNNIQANLRADFKQSLSKLLNISTREQALKQAKTLIIKNKTTNNLRIWLSVLNQSRQKHSQSEIVILSFIIQQYQKGLLDPLDKIPSLQKTVFRITEMIIKFFVEQTQNVVLACKKAWIMLYDTTLKDQSAETKKKLLYDNLEAIINGGGGRVAQLAAQDIIQGLLQTALTKQDHEFFKQIAKRVLVMFMKTTIEHPSTLISLTIVLTYFSINNLLPLLEQIINKILAYIASAKSNSIGYKIKSEACNCLDNIGNDIDRNGLQVYERVHAVLANMASDKVWAVQITGRKALATWRKKKQEWDQQFQKRNQKMFKQVSQLAFPNQNYQNNNNNQHEYVSHPYTNTQHQNFYEDNADTKNMPQRRTYQNNWMPDNNNIGKWKTHDNWKQAQQYHNERQRSPSPQNPKFLLKNTGIGGGNSFQAQEQYQKIRGPHQETYARKMEEIKKSIYRDPIQFDDTVPWQQAEKLPAISKSNQVIEPSPDEQPEIDIEFLQEWQKIIELADKQEYQRAVRKLIQMDDDIYFLRFLLKYCNGPNNIIESLTRQTSNMLLKKMLQIKATNFLQQMLFTMVGQTIKSGFGGLLSNSQNMTIKQKLEQCQRLEAIAPIADKLLFAYERSLQQ